jgi:hypothetical protein
MTVTTPDTLDETILDDGPVCEFQRGTPEAPDGYCSNPARSQWEKL